MLDGLVFPSAARSASRRPATEDALEDPAFRREFRSRVGFVFQEADVSSSAPTAPTSWPSARFSWARGRRSNVACGGAQQLRIEGLLDRPP